MWYHAQAERLCSTSCGRREAACSEKLEAVKTHSRHMVIVPDIEEARSTDGPLCADNSATALAAAPSDAIFEQDQLLAAWGVGSSMQD